MTVSLCGKIILLHAEKYSQIIPVENGKRKSILLKVPNKRQNSNVGFFDLSTLSGR